MHLLGRDIVDGDDEDGLVVLQQALQLVEVPSLVRGFAPHVFFLLKLGCLRAGIFFGVDEEQEQELASKKVPLTEVVEFRCRIAGCVGGASI